MLVNIQGTKLDNNKLGISVSFNIVSDKNQDDLYIDTLQRLIVAFDEQFSYRHNIYRDTPNLVDKLKDIVRDDMFSETKEIVNYENILDIKRQVDAVFSKYLPSTTENMAENTEGLDLELMDKITPLVPEGKEILLKNIVKEINGSAKGLSDFVIMFTKYRQTIINYNNIEYFQRKGCHFLRKI